MKIATVIGARPQFIKAAMVSKAIANYNNINEVIIHTGQHFDDNMSKIFFMEMDIPKPNYNLGIQSAYHGSMTGRQLEGIEKILIKENPDFILVYGDTNSTLAGALSAAKLNIPVAHVEAGLRSFNKRMPEEINRVLTDHISNLLFVPTDTAKENLICEGIEMETIYKVGDVMYDASLHFYQIAEEKSDILDKLNLEPKKYILCTVHRQENTDNPEKLKNIFNALSKSELPVIIPLHPRTKKMLAKNNITLNGHIVPIKPLGYLDMILIEKNALKIATDSGGVQKEAFFYQVPCITLREETEWVELISAGANRLSGTNKKQIITLLNTALSFPDTKQFYGDGNAAEKIIDTLLKY
jgi:UDP-GlcNAc3NAcA epimerase